VPAVQLPAFEGQSSAETMVKTKRGFDSGFQFDSVFFPESSKIDATFAVLATSTKFKGANLARAFSSCQR
jgi:hypothetical protein